MPGGADFPKRRSLRLREYDYAAPGAYFITVCARRGTFPFGRVLGGEMRLSLLGKVVFDEWFRTATVRPNVCLREDEFVVMPNHVHGIIWILETTKSAIRGVASPRIARPAGPRSGSLGAIVGQFKRAVTSRIRTTLGGATDFAWQRNYWEHIVRDERSLSRIRQYIAENPLRWELDRENPQRKGEDEFERWLRTAATPPCPVPFADRRGDPVGRPRPE